MKQQFVSDNSSKMKFILLLCFSTILCYSASGLKCHLCENPLDKHCEEKKLVECDSPDDFCVDMHYEEKMEIWKQCIRKELVDVCERKVDGIDCAACQFDGCNNLSHQDFIEAVKESKSQDILSPILKRKQKENNGNMKKVHVVKQVVTKQHVH